MLENEPTGDAPSDAAPTSETPAPAKKATRRRATSKPADAPDAVAADTPDDAGTETEAAETPAPAKRVRKAPAKKAAPRKKAAAKADPAADDAVLEVLGDAQPAVVDAIEDDPVVAGDAVQDVSVAPEVLEPVKRTRKRVPAAVTFQAPPAVEPEAAADEEEPPAPRRRRRAGTDGAISPSALLPTLVAPEETAPPADTDADDDDDPDRPRRRRRGRRGRGSRAEGGEESTSSDEPAEGEDTSDDEQFETAADGTRRRRRRRRRSGSAGADTTPDENDPPGTVVHVREPRQQREPREPRSRAVRGASEAGEDGVRGISGSTRMAAKRVRRQEGRDSGRGRVPILTEAEFLSRREAVERVMVVRQKGDRTQIAVLEDGILVEHYVTKASAQSYAGNVYLGKVQNVLPSMEAAFVDVGKGRNAVLYAGEVNYDLMGSGAGPRKIESVLKSGQEVLAQVSKDPMGHKGARLTSQVSLPGRYLVYVPEGSMTGISRKLPENERTRLKAILKKVVPEDAGVIIRTAAEGASEEELAGDVRRLQAQWEVIKTKAAQGGAPKLLHAEPDLLIRVVRDIFNEDFAQLVVEGDSEWDTIREYVEFVAPDLAPRLRRHEGPRDVFEEHRIDEQLAKALDRKVWLPSGGSLVIDRTEAMIVIDVNTGKYVGKGGNLEETVTRNNLEAAEEIARQLRLRDLGGIIVVDFIDMVLESNRDLVVRRLAECMGRDRTKHQIAEVTSLGLVQMTRKRVGQGLLESFSEPCEACQGRGVIVHEEPVDEKKQRVERFDDRPRGGDRGPKPPAASPEETSSEGAAPKRRSRGGRGRGGRSEGAPVEEVVSEAVGDVDVTPDLAEQPPTELEDQPVLPESPEPEPEPEPEPVLRRVRSASGSL
ncbi:MAG: Rne/Rng family ribonuclease [Actinobacteria bacterium]|nr:Rne/Rng family ribonuclease [Actinomycetota bacterium]